MSIATPHTLQLRGQQWKRELGDHVAVLGHYETHGVRAGMSSTEVGLCVARDVLALTSLWRF